MVCVHPIEISMAEGWLEMVFRWFGAYLSKVFAAHNHFAHSIIILHKWILRGVLPP